MQKPANSDREIHKLLRFPAVQERTGLSRSALYRLCAEGDFPSPVKLTERSSAWVESEVDDWVNAKVKERNRAG